MQRQFGNYNEITATPETHLEFIQSVADQLSGLDATNLYEHLKKNIEVDGKPFSQAAHLIKLENNSYNWDFDEVEDEVKVKIVEATGKIAQVDPHYDLGHFTTGFDYMVNDLKERGIPVNVSSNLVVEEQAPKATHNPDNDFTYV